MIKNNVVPYWDGKRLMVLAKAHALVDRGITGVITDPELILKRIERGD